MTLTVIFPLEGIPSSAGSFTWEVDDSLGEAAVYGIKIQLEEDPEIFQYSFPFAITPDEDHSGHSSSAPASTSAPSTKTKTHTSKPSDYPTASPSVSSTLIPVYTVSSNLSITTSGSTSVPTESSGTSATGTATTSTSAPAATGAATTFAANGFAVLGGLAMAALAL